MNSNQATEEATIKVGDDLVFDMGYNGSHWKIITVEKITASGIIKCGDYDLNAELKVVGGRPFRGGPYVAFRLTSSIRQEMIRQTRLRLIEKTNFNTLDDVSLAIVVEAIRS